MSRDKWRINLTTLNMKLVKYLFMINFILLVTLSLQAQEIKQSNINELLASTNRDNAILFADGDISTGLNEFNATFTPEMNCFYFSIRHRMDYFVIMKCYIVNDVFQKPEIAEFSGQYNDADPFISTDGRFLYFCSDRYTDDSDTLQDWNIWRMEKSGDSWNNLLLLPFNTPNKNEMYPTVAKNGNIYFHSDYESPKEGLDFNGTNIYVAEMEGQDYTGFQKVNNMSSDEFPEWDPFISPDEDYLIFTSPRKDSYGGGDLYISFKLNNGDWSTPKNMGPIVNSIGMDYCPNLSPDGSLLFFSSYRNEIDFNSRPNSYDEIKKRINAAKNGNGDIYFISSDIINELR